MIHLREVQSYISTIALLAPTQKQKMLTIRDTPAFREILSYTYNPYITFGVKTTFKRGEVLLRNEPIESGDFDLSWPDLRDALNKFAARELTGYAAVQRVHSLLYRSHPDVQYLVHCILNKDLKAGISADSINKAFPGLIPLFACSLAEDYSDKRARWPMLAEVKWDGKRIIAIVHGDEVTLYSRNGLIDPKYQHIRDEIAALRVAMGSDFVLDGELMFGMFGKRTEADKIYKVFDYMPLSAWISGDCDEQQAMRGFNLMNIVGSNFRILPHIEYSQPRRVDNFEAAEKFYSEVVALGGEGIMLKNPTAPYTFKRGSHWLKMKPVKEEDLTITGWFEGEGRLEEMLGGLIVNREGVQVRVGSGFSDSQRLDFWNRRNQLEGVTAEIRYTEVTPDGSLRFPRFVKLREDK